MSRLKRVGMVILIFAVLALALIGALTVTRGTPVGIRRDALGDSARRR